MIQYTPSGRLSAGLSTTITITFTPQMNQDINGVLPLLSETGPIDIPIVCTCKKALVNLSSEEQANVDFGSVIFGEQCTRQVKLRNEGALPTKIYVKTNDGRTIPFVNQEDLQKKIDEMNAKDSAAEVPAVDEKELEDSNEVAAKEDTVFAKESHDEDQ